MSAIFEQAAADWREMKRDYDEHLEGEYFRAEEATNGFMVSAAGRLRGLTNSDVYLGAYRRYASDELLEWLKDHPRPTLERYELQWLRAARRLVC